MEKMIVYGSCYGNAKKYAEKFSEMTQIPVTSYEDIKTLDAYEEVIHFGGLYAGGVKGLKNTVKLLPQDARLIIVTVGAADVTVKQNTDHIKKMIAQCIPETVLERTTILHLRGGIDYSKLSFIHKTMMSFVYKQVKNKPDEEKTAEDRGMIETYGQKVDFTDFDSLQQVLDVI